MAMGLLHLEDVLSILVTTDTNAVGRESNITIELSISGVVALTSNSNACEDDLKVFLPDCIIPLESDKPDPDSL